MLERKLIEALHYIKKFKGKTFVIKFGGEILEDENVLDTVAEDLCLLHDIGIKLVVMHGAGTLISSNMRKFGLEPEFVRGERVTDEKTLELVISSLIRVNNKIVGNINKNNPIAIGLGGSVFRVRRKRKELGYVGEVIDVNSKLLSEIIESGYMPVIFPIGIDESGNSFNINADVVAGEIAKALNATKMIILTNVDGVLDRNGRLIKQLDIKSARELIKNEVVTGGMIPKLESGIRALSEGVERVHIVKAGEHAILGELLTKEGSGTMLLR